MEAGTSQATVPIQAAPRGPPRNERKPRNKLKKGKQREGRAKVTNLEIQQPSTSTSGLVDTQKTSSWAWESLTDASISNRPPVFTNDCRYFFLIAGSSVKIYSTTTGQVVSTLSSSSSGSGASSSQLSDGHTDEITAAFINPRNAFQLITASMDGRIKIWDYLEAALLSTLEVGEPITHMCAHEHIPGYVFVATSAPKRTKKDEVNVLKEQSKVFQVSLSPSKTTADSPTHKPVEKLKVGKMRATTGLAISPSGEWLVATGGPKAYVCSTSSISSGFTKFVSNETLTCLAFHPSEEYFATGDEKGQVRLWYCLDPAQISSLSQGEKRAQTTTLHWHAHAVSSIAFTGNGSYLLSGGEEAVLVIWQLHTGKREYIPRVGAPIVSVAVASHKSAEEEYMLVLSDATVVFVGSGTLRVSRSFSRVKHDPALWSSGPAPVAVHANTSTAILPSSHPSSILIYSPLTSTLISELEVSPSNRVSRRDEKAIEPLRVDRVVVSGDGMWLATIDGREGDEDFERETYMKIWQWDPLSTSWNLNTRVDRPHGVHRVNALVFVSIGDLSFLVSTGNDGNTKVWRPRSVSTKKGEQEVFWVCRSTLGYRSKIPTEAACSPDGSLLGVAYGRYLAIYDISSNSIRDVLSCPELKEIRHVAFVGSSGRYVIIADRRSVVVWDLVASNVMWHHLFTSDIYHVIPHPQENTFVVMHPGSKTPTALHKFTLASTVPVASHTLPFKLLSVVWCPFTASGNDFGLVGITDKWSSVILGDRVNLLRDEGSSANGLSGDTVPLRRNLFQDIFGAAAFQDFSTTQPSTIPSGTREEVHTGVLKSSNILNTPAYLLPPLHTLYTSLVEGFLQKRDIQSLHEAENPEEVADEEDVIMEDSEISHRTPTTNMVLGKEQMAELIDLFQQQTFVSSKSRAPTSKPTSHLNGNGVVKTNGSHRPKVPPSAVTSNGYDIQKRPTEQEDPVGPAVVGKKRKKSMG